MHCKYMCCDLSLCLQDVLIYSSSGKLTKVWLFKYYFIMIDIIRLCMVSLYYVMCICRVKHRHNILHQWKINLI